MSNSKYVIGAEEQNYIEIKIMGNESNSHGACDSELEISGKINANKCQETYEDIFCVPPPERIGSISPDILKKYDEMFLR
ncbi:hypothetical protein AYI68_g5444 [Smittium mucronatum]|uniref:Uncharacterized protein n=1 Tax=Smittium mucronatum TaxID=133383 RepID=A0A1R0GUA2_9FUNG|nr:hypothetical protein AYI68_g5444 [Smittium mucronatum]